MLKEQAPPADALTTDVIYRSLGPGFQIAPGIVLRREWQLGNDAVRLDMQHQQGTSFHCKIEINGQLRWQDNLDVRNFPSAAVLVQKAMKSPAQPPQQAPAAQPQASNWDPNEMPVSGEIWVMSIQRLDASEEEVRYVTINRDGQSFGAPRVLPRQDFERLFMAVSQAFYRLVVKVTGVDGGMVQYQHLDAQRQPAGDPRSIDIPAFVTTFLAEAAAY